MWSPDGRYIAFVRGTTSNTSKILIANGRGQIRWRFGLGHYNSDPLWSHDGRDVAYFASWAHIYALLIARFDGSETAGVAESPAFPTYGPTNPAWVPGTQRLAFVDGNWVDTPQGIFTVARDGSDRQRLLPDARQPAFSPDGSTLACVAVHNWQTGDLRLADADGRNSRVLAAQSGQLSWGTPAWSPDGKQLAFIQDTLLNGQTVHTDLIVAAADGSSRRTLASATAPVDLSDPVWSPNGTFVAYVRSPKHSIVVARADGSGRHVAVAHSNGDLPAWIPAARLPAAKRPPCPRR